MRILGWATALVVLLCAGPLQAQEVERAPTPAWVQPLGQDGPASAVDGAPVRILAMDQQVRIDHDGIDTYTFKRIRIQTAQGLGLVSTITAAWSPPRETLQVHAIRIRRGDEIIDALDGQAFQTLRRENNLESSTLDGVLTATFQPRDLRVGDILETSFTIHDSGGVLAPHRELLDSLNPGMVVDRYRSRTTWPADVAMRFKGLGSWAAIAPHRTRDGWELVIDQRDLQPARMPDDLPPRYYLDRVAQFTDFADWSDLAAVMYPLYVKSTTLEPGSPLLQEIERIRAANATPQAQAAAALRLVQDQVRYVALAMGEGGYVPASADDVWRNRYGDCKGKTTLLVALLHGLGIKAEPAIVTTRFGDGLETQLPLVAWFDHIIVRAEIDGQTYWLDGTQSGDRELADVSPPPYRWALPVREGATGLEAIAAPPATRAANSVAVVVDASKGLDSAGEMTMDLSYTGATATVMRQRIASIPPDQVEAMMKSSMADNKTIEVRKVETRYDEPDNSFHIVMTGTLRLPWVAESGGRLLPIDGTGLSAPTQAERTQLFAAYKDAPYVVEYPAQTRQSFKVILPNGGEGFRLEGGDQVVESGGYRMARTGRIANGAAEVEVVFTSLAPEISAADMKAARTRNETLSSAGIRVRAPVDYRATEADASRLSVGDSGVDDLLERAKALKASADDAGSLALLDAAVAMDAENAKARMARGEARLANRDYAGAREDYDHAVDLDPADVKALLGQGGTALRDGRNSDAVVSYSVALRLDAGNTTALWGRAAAYYQIGRWDRALTDYRALKTAAPDSQVAASGEVRALVHLGRLAEARTLVDDRLKTEPTDAAALDGLTRLAIVGGKPADALPALDAALAAAPESGTFLSLRGQMRALSGDDAGARADFDAYRATANGDPQVLNNVCWGKALAGFDLEAALADCDAAIEAAGSASFIDSRAMALLQMDRYAEAKAAYDQALAAYPTMSPSLYGRGLARLSLGEAEGQADVDRAKALNIDAADDFGAFLARHPDLAH